MSRRRIPRWATVLYAACALVTVVLYLPDVGLSRLTFTQWLGLVWLIIWNSAVVLVFEALLILTAVRAVDFIHGRTQPEEKRDDYSSDVANLTP